LRAETFRPVDSCSRSVDTLPHANSRRALPFAGYAQVWALGCRQHQKSSLSPVLAACVERGLGWLHSGGLLGAINFLTAFFLTSYRKGRQRVVLGDAEPVVMADLRYGVVDAAMVKAAAYVLRKHSSDSQPRDNDHA
jgi:hypothetical protein